MPYPFRFDRKEATFDQTNVKSSPVLAYSDSRNTKGGSDFQEASVFSRLPREIEQISRIRANLQLN